MSIADVTYLAVAAGCLVALVVVLATGRGSASASDGAAQLRSRPVPGRAGETAVARALREAGIDHDRVERVLGVARREGIDPVVLGWWLAERDAESLALAVTAGVGSAALHGHLADGTEPDLEHLRVFAALQGHLAPVPPAPSAPSPKRARTGV